MVNDGVALQPAALQHAGRTSRTNAKTGLRNFQIAADEVDVTCRDLIDRPATMQLPSSLTPEDLALSPMFIDFVARWLEDSFSVNEHWFDQRSEPVAGSAADIRAKATARLERILTNKLAQDAIDGVYKTFHELATGNSAALEEIHAHYDFIAIVGVPRNGGSYLTGEIYSALGFDPHRVPASIAHDGFPDARPFAMFNESNSWIAALMTASEYLTMIKLFFPIEDDHSRVIVPKKLTKGIYAGSFFRHLFGPSAEFLVTVRNPIACCMSTYERAGGLPADGKFIARSLIEKWIKRDVEHTGINSEELTSMDYFSAYVRYWEQFHINLAMSGLIGGRGAVVIPYGKDSMEAAAATYHRRFKSERPVSGFVAQPGRDDRHISWKRRSELAIERVATVWNLVGLCFPYEEVLRCA